MVTFGYDAFGRRVWKRSGVRETHYMWMGNSLLSEVTYQSGQPVSYQDYLYLPDNNRFSDKYFRTQALINQQEITYSGFEGLFEEYTSEVVRSKNRVGLQFDSSQRFSALSLYIPLATRINGEIYYYHTDHLGAPRRLTNAQGKVVWAADYSAFGYAFVSIEEITNHLRLPGQYFDTETGLHYNRFRYYLPILGRYISRDPMRYLGGSNFYLYARNNPINAVDPLGLFPWLILAVVAGVAVMLSGCKENSRVEEEGVCVKCASKTAKNKKTTTNSKKKCVLSDNNKKFIDEVNDFYDDQIRNYQNKYDKKVADYKNENWAQNDEDPPFKDFLERIEKCQEDKNKFNEQINKNKEKHCNDLFTLANVVFNEAGTSNDKAKEAIAYAYLNRTGNVVREPKDSNEISHYQELYNRYQGLTDTEKYTFIPNFTDSMEAAGNRLSDVTPSKNDPTHGATHWVSPKGLENRKKEGYYYRDDYKTYFPTWARANDDPLVKQYIEENRYDKNYSESSVEGVPGEDFLFYIGVH